MVNSVSLCETPDGQLFLNSQSDVNGSGDENSEIDGSTSSSVDTELDDTSGGFYRSY